MPEMNEYIDAIFENRLEDAKKHLLSGIASAKEMNAPPVLAGLAQRLGSVLLKQGDSSAAICLYELSECLDPGSLLAKLDYAKFLLCEVGDKTASAEKCRGIISLAKANPFPGSEEDFSSDEYIEAAERVLQESLAS